MSTNVSLANPDTSLNFDGQALHNQQDGEIEREEQQEEHELHQLVFNAFDDLDDDILSLDSSDGYSANVSNIFAHQEKLVTEFASGQETSSDRGFGSSNAATSVTPTSCLHPFNYSFDQSKSVDKNVINTSQGSDTPTLRGEFFQHNWEGNAWTNIDHYYQMEQKEANHENREESSLTPRHDQGIGPYFLHSGQVFNEDLGSFQQQDLTTRWNALPAQEYFKHQHHVLTSTDNDIGKSSPFPGMDIDKTVRKANCETQALNSQSDGFQNPYYSFSNQQHPFGADTGERYSQVHPNFYQTNSEQASSEKVGVDKIINNLPPQTQILSAENLKTPNRNVVGMENDYTDVYKVQYLKAQTSGKSEISSAHEVHEEFIQQEGDNEVSQQFAQLQVLYRSRGRQLEDVISELELVKHETAKERRLLKHKLTVATGEKEGLEQSLNECQKLLQESKEEQTQTAGKLRAFELQLQVLKDNKEEMVKKLQSAETTIENLTHQLSELHQSDSLAQARNQYETSMSRLQERHNAEILALKEKLDMANETISEKTKEITTLWKQVAEQTKIAENAQISRADTVNQLTRSLEESQKRCKALLESSSSQEVSELKAQLQQAKVSKKMSDSMCNSLQDELKDLKEQLNMLESASSLGVFSHSHTHPGAVYNDSMADLGIRKTLDFSTPDSPNKFDGSHSSDELVSRLRRELERCIQSNKQKRLQVAELQEQTGKLQKQLSHLQEQTETSHRTISNQQVKLLNYEERIGNDQHTSAVESRLKKEIENLQLEKKALLQDIDDYKKRLNELSATEEQLTEMNRLLTNQIGQMIHEHDEDKREALDRCRRTLEDMHVTAKENLEHSLRSEFFADKQELIWKYERQLNDAKEELQAVQQELDKVKDMYVQASQELARQEQTLTASFQNRLLSELEKQRQKLEEEKSQLLKERNDQENDKIDTLKESLREEVKQEFQKEALKQTDNQINQLKALLEQEKQVALMHKEEELIKLKTLLEQEKQTALLNKEEELIRLKVLLEQEKQAALQHKEEEWLIKLKQQLADAEHRITTERSKWEIENHSQQETLFKERLGKERLTWQVQNDRETIKQIDIAVDQAKRQCSLERDQQLAVLKVELQNCQIVHKEEILKMEAKWKQDLAESVAAVERAVQAECQVKFEKEKEECLAIQKKTMLVETHQKLTAELATLSEKKNEEFSHQLEQEKGRILRESRQERERILLEAKQERERILLEAKLEIKNAVDDTNKKWEKEFLEEKSRLEGAETKEILKWKSEAAQFQAQLKEKSIQWKEEMQRLLKEKDEERRQAVADVRVQCQDEYKRFMEENKTSLSSALTQAHKGHNQKNDELVHQHQEELNALRLVQQELQQVLTDGQHHLSAAGMSASDKQKLLKKIDRLKKEIVKRDELLKQADSHMEQEIQRLQQSMEENYTKQREKDALRLQLHYIQSMNINQKERTRLERQIERIVEEFNKEKERHAQQVDAFKEELSEKTQTIMDLEQQRQEELFAQYTKQLAEFEKENEKMQFQLKETRLIVEKLSEEKNFLVAELDERDAWLQEERNKMSVKLEDYQTTVRSLEEEKENLAQELASIAHQHQEEVASLHQMQEEAKVQHRKLEAALTAVNRQHREDMERMQMAHQQEIQALQEQLEQVDKKYEIALEECEQQHQAEKLELLQQVHKQAERLLAHTPTQTDLDDSLNCLKDQYVTTVKKTTGEVMNHIGQSNQRAAMALWSEIRMERQRTIEHLRKRCKSRLRLLLQAHLERSQVPEIWSLIDQTLDSIFDYSRSSCSATPSTSISITPRSSEEETQQSIQDHSLARDAKNPVTQEHFLKLFRDHTTSNSFGNESVGALSTAQSSESERYALPAHLSKVTVIDHMQSDCSLNELKTSGMYLPLVPDETASIAESDVFADVDAESHSKHANSEQNIDHVKTNIVAVRGSKSLPTKEKGSEVGFHRAKTVVSSFRDREVFQSTNHTPDSLTTPRLHTDKQATEEWEEPITEQSDKWKALGADMWTKAVGSTNLWQAFSDLQELDQEKNPRKKLRFGSDTFLDKFGDPKKENSAFVKYSDKVTGNDRVSSSETAVAKNKAPDKDCSIQLKTSSLATHNNTLSWQSENKQTKHSPTKYKSMESLLPSALDSNSSLKRYETFSQKNKEIHESKSNADRLEKSPFKTFQNSEASLSKQKQTPSPEDTKQRQKEPETLDAMMERLGIGATHIKNSKQRLVDVDMGTEGRKKSDNWIPENKFFPQDADAGHRHRRPNTTGTNSQKLKSRTCSADRLFSKKTHSGQHHLSGTVMNSSFTSDSEPWFSTQYHQHGELDVLTPVRSVAPHSYQPAQHGRRHRPEMVTQRSLEENNFHHMASSSLSQAGKAKSRSEQALHLLSEALESEWEDGTYRYMSLRKSLPPASPSTSLLSTYSISEGDLRLVPYEAVSRNNEVF